MARTKAEVRAFLDNQVGSIPQHPAPYGAGSGQDLSGQCVTGIKVLMDFLGVPNPYAARGNAKDVDDTLLRQGIAQDGRGWLTIVVNKDMGYIGGVHYGHIWIDLQNEANYETNGAQALHTTKNTRPFSQGQQFVNLDSYIKENDMGQVEDLQRQVAGLQAELEGERRGYDAMVNDRNAQKERADGLDTELTAERKTYEAWIASLKAGGSAGPTCTADERVFLDTMYKVVTKKG